MANGIVQGGNGTFQSELLDNGQPIALPTNATWAWTSSDSGATITPDPSDPTGGTVIVAIPGGDSNATVTITASTTDPSGNTVSGDLTVPVTPSPQIFTVSVTQTA